MQTENKQQAAERRLFFSGVVFLGASNIIVKVIGLFFKIPMSYTLGDVGMGYFSAAYQIYTWLYMLSTAGLPVAVSILISERRAYGDLGGVRRIVKLSGAVFLMFGIGGSLLMFFGADALARLIGSPDAAFCIAAMSPTLFFICVSSALRGYFQGYRQMAPSAVSQVLEALGKLAVGVTLAYWAQGKGYSLPMTAAFAVSGLAVGEAAGTVYLLIMRRRYERDGRLPSLSSQTAETASHGTLRRLFDIAFPITVSASVMSLSGLIDLVLIQRRLQDIGYSVEEATAFYGNYTTLAVPMFNLPPALIYPIATAVTPVLAAAFAQNGRGGASRTVNALFRVTVLIALPCAFGLSVLARPILRLLFPLTMADSAAPYLSVLALGVVFLSLLTVSNTVLQASGNAGKATFSMLIGAAFKFAANYLLIGIPSVGAFGVPIGTVLCYLSATLCNLLFAFRRTSISLAFSKIFLRPLAASLLSVGAASGLYLALGGDAAGRFSVIFCILLAIPVYLASVFLLGCLTEEDLKFVPGGMKIYSFLHKGTEKRSFLQKK